MTPADGRSSQFRFVPSQEEAIFNANSRLPGVVGLLIFLVLFFGVVAGTAYIQMGSEVLGIAIYIVAAVAVVLLYLAGRMIAQS